MRLLDCTRLSPAEQETAIQNAAAETAVFAVRGWRAAERNLDFLAVWLARLFCCGPRSAYLDQGGIEGTVARALHMPSSAWRVVARTNSRGGALSTLRVEKIPDSDKKNLTAAPY